MIAPRVIIEVRFGPLSSRKAIVAPASPGATLRVGRSNIADLVMPHDAQMSAEHFSLTWDGSRCLLRDLGSARGTSLGGAPLAGEAEVTNGAWIRAGESNFMVYFEGHSPAPRDTQIHVHAEEKARARAALAAEAGPLFAIVDASRGPRPLQLLREAVDDHRSLYDGTGGEALANVAPYLVSLRRDSGLLDRLIAEGWGERWGVYFTCALPAKDVRRHLRRFLMVADDETGEKLYFRFYDPATLRAFLPSSTPRQRADFFGEIACFFTEGEDGELLRFSRTPSPEISWP